MAHLGFGDPIKQYKGQAQVDRGVKVKSPGRHYNNLTAAEQAVDYWAQAVEFQERHSFGQHRSWGARQTGPGIRFITESDAIDDPDNKGFWVPLPLWNCWRHDTYKDDREAEKVFLDELPAATAADAASPAKEKSNPAVKEAFQVVGSGTHTVGGVGRMAGKQMKFELFSCKKEGCWRGPQKPIKQIGTGTGELFSHLDICQPDLAKKLRAASAYSPVRMDADGQEYCLYSFNELLPHHIRYVQKCFQGLDHFYETRADNGLLEYVQGFDKRANLPAEQTCLQILEVCTLPCCTCPSRLAGSYMRGCNPASRSPIVQQTARQQTARQPLTVPPLTCACLGAGHR